MNDGIPTVAPTTKAKLNLAPIATSGSASDLTAGTVPDARLSTNVTQKNGLNVYTNSNVFRTGSTYNGVGGVDSTFPLSVESTRTLGGGDTLGDRYEVLRVGDGRGSQGSHRIGFFQKRGPLTGSWEYTQWVLGRYVDSTTFGEIQFGGANAHDVIQFTASGISINTDVIPGNGLLQLASGTTKANGIALGDTFFFRSAAGLVYLDGTAATDRGLYLTTGTVTGYSYAAHALNAYLVGSLTAHSLNLRTNNTDRITISATGDVTATNNVNALSFATSVASDSSTGIINALTVTAGFMRLTGAAPDLRGMPNPGKGLLVTVYFVNAGNLRNAAGTAAADARIATSTGADIVVAAGKTYLFHYDTTSTVWRQIG